jgi:methyl-accepting chemotaxis protein
MAEGLEYNANVADKIAAGDLTAEIKLSSDHDRLSLAMQGMIEQMSDSLSVVRMTAGEVSAGSTELASSSQSLSQGATEQAASLEEITSSMVEISSQSRANADNAEQANRLARDSKTAGENSREKMQEMVQAVSEINNSSREIAKIIKVIDDIAFQTNLLALNAAVEAARAGKHGKGFAVVAEEVRNLAARSAKAAKETAELIDNSVKKVEDGTKIAVQTSESLEQIVVGAAKVADYLAEIAAASNEQALGVEQVNTGLSQVDQVTQAMSANAEETAAASEELSAQSERLMEVLNRFRFKNTAENEFNISNEKKQITGTGRIPDSYRNQNPKLPKGRVVSSISLSDDEFGKY